jgi:TPR repeat protein
MYLKGSGVPQDDAEAVKWIQRAATQGDAYAQYNLGLMYAQGRGVIVKDERQAIGWLTKSADGGYAPAALLLRQMSGGK